MIYSDTVASTSRPIHIKGGKPLSFYESYYAKINSEKLRSVNRGNGAGRKKIKIGPSYSQVPASASSGGKKFMTKPPASKEHGDSRSKSYTEEGNKSISVINSGSMRCNYIEEIHRRTKETTQISSGVKTSDGN